MMKALLMYRDGDFDPEGPLPPNETGLVQDLELDTLFGAMAAGDAYLAGVARHALLTPLTDPAAIVYRQDIVKDCLAHPEVVREIYALAVRTIEDERKKHWGLLRDYPDIILHRSVDVLGLFVVSLRQLRRIADAHADRFASEGFTTLFALLRRELSDAYFAEVEAHLKELKFGGGVLISARLGPGNKGVDYVLRRPRDTDRSWWRRLFAETEPSYSYQVAPRDENGARMLGELTGRGINLVANALAQSNDHILSFFRQLRAELGFHLGCLNLHARLTEIGEPACIPIALPAAERSHAFTNLYDLSLALSTGRRVVGNDIDADGRGLVVITGANQGGKSTFLRAIGIAQLMLQAGVFVPAATFRANVCTAVFTHYKREEDANMQSGKLDEELGRMSAIVDALVPDALVLFNESFAATNDREGSEIARQVVEALAEARVEVFYVTHLHEFARGLYDRNLPGLLSLRAERKEDGARTFRLRPGEPLRTSFGADVYHEVFGPARAA